MIIHQLIDESIISGASWIMICVNDRSNSKTEIQHVGISIQSLRSGNMFDDLAISVDPCKSEIVMKNMGYVLDTFW